MLQVTAPTTYPELFEESRETDIEVEQMVYRHAVQEDAGGEWRVITSAARDTTDLASLPPVPHYSSEPDLAEQAFRDAVILAGENRDEFEVVRPRDIYGDAWGIRPMAQNEPLVTAPNRAVLFCRGAIAVLRGHDFDHTTR